MNSDKKPPHSDFNQGERRQLTVLFCDLVKSTELLEELSVEDWAEVLHVYHSHCLDIIESCNGYVAQFLGDGLLAYFGYPVAHDYSAQGAVKAGLEIVNQIEHISDKAFAAITAKANKLSLQVRIAVHTGRVVVDALGHDKSRNYMALGVVPAIASRLQEHAAPDTIVVSGDTQSLIDDAFSCTNLGAYQLKGISEPLQIYQVLAEKTLQGRFELLRRKNLTPFVGRVQELKFLHKIWRDCSRGAARLVLVNGDPGIGKSRLIQQFAETIVDEDFLELSCHCSPYHQSSPLYPVINLIVSLVGIAEDDDNATQLNKVKNVISATGLLLNTTMPLICRLLSIDYLSEYANLELTQPREKTALLEILCEYFFELAKTRPLLFLVEDFHWSDPSTIDFLKYFAKRYPDANSMIIISHRPELVPPWQQGPMVQQLTLGPLPQSSAESMVHSLLPGDMVPADVSGQLLSYTDGVPLFLEESVLMLMSARAAKVGESKEAAIPSSLQDLLMARLDSLGAAKQTAQIAAVLGRDFSYDNLIAISQQPIDSLNQHLETLVDAGLVFKVEAVKASHFSFKHALIRDTAYRSLPAKKLRELHNITANSLLNSVHSVAQNQPEIIAHHYTEAGVLDKAVDYWKQAGRLSVNQHAHKEAAAHFQRSLALLDKIPESLSRQQIELEITLLLASRLIATQGYGAMAVKENYLRAQQLARDVDDQPKLLKTTLGLESFYFMHGQFELAQEMAQASLLVAQGLDNPVSIIKVHWTLGEISFHQGNHVQAQQQFLRCINLHDKKYHSHKTLQDPAVMSHCYYAWSRWMAGFADSAVASVTEAINLAVELDHPFSRAVAYSFACGLYLFRGEWKNSLEYSELAMDICREYGFSAWLGFSTVVNGRAMVLLGEVDAGIETLGQGLALWSKTGAVVTKPYCHTLLAESLLCAQQYEPALQEINNAQAIVDETGEGYYQSEIFRVKAEILRRGADHIKDVQANAVEDLLLKSLLTARKQSVKSLELRALSSMLSINLAPESAANYHRQLADLYGWFDEGAGTLDMAVASALLKQANEGPMTLN